MEIYKLKIFTLWVNVKKSLETVVVNLLIQFVVFICCFPSFLNTDPMDSTGHHNKYFKIETYCSYFYYFHLFLSNSGKYDIVFPSLLSSHPYPFMLEASHILHVSYLSLWHGCCFIRGNSHPLRGLTYDIIRLQVGL